MSWAIVGSTSSLPTSGGGYDQGVRYGNILEWRAGWLTCNTAAPFAASPTHANSYQTALATEVSLVLEGKACPLVSHSLFEKPFQTQPILLSAHDFIDLEAKSNDQYLLSLATTMPEREPHYTPISTALRRAKTGFLNPAFLKFWRHKPGWLSQRHSYRTPCIKARLGYIEFCPMDTVVD